MQGFARVKYFCGKFVDGIRSLSVLYLCPAAWGALRGSVLRDFITETRVPVFSSFSFFELKT